MHASHLRCTRQRLHQLTTNRWRKLLLWRRDQLFPCLFASLCCPVIAAQISLRVSVFFEYGLQFSSFLCSWVKRQACLLFKWFINDQWFIILKLAGSEGVLSFLLLFSCHYFLEPGWASEVARWTGSARKPRLDLLSWREDHMRFRGLVTQGC